MTHYKIQPTQMVSGEDYWIVTSKGAAQRKTKFKFLELNGTEVKVKLSRNNKKEILNLEEMTDTFFAKDMITTKCFTSVANKNGINIKFISEGRSTKYMKFHVVDNNDNKLIRVTSKNLLNKNSGFYKLNVENIAELHEELSILAQQSIDDLEQMIAQARLEYYQNNC